MWETVIGIEVHAELSTKSKIFCACSTAFGADPNTHVCPVCSGMPGALPKLNREVVEYAMRLGLALNCAITGYGKFDRKNYFYPDLPKGYQISQLYAPICRDGYLETETGGQKRRINIREIHIEEDAGKLIHDPLSGGTLMDFNRCGVPLLEIVTQPDFRNGEEVTVWLEKLRETLLYLGICDCKMQEGSIRADVNLSVHLPGTDFGTRTEMKNLNSFKAIYRAIEYETVRQTEMLENGEPVVQETRRWDDDKGESFGMRSKENAQDYRYFPDPDLLPVRIDDIWLKSVRDKLPELACQKRERYQRDYGLSESEASVLTGHKKISDLFESVSRLSGEPTEASRLIAGEVMRLINKAKILPEDLSVDPLKLSSLIALLSAGKINRNVYKETAEAVFIDDIDPESYIVQKGLMMISDDAEVSRAVDAVLSANPGAVAEFRSGKEKMFDFLMGQVMRHLKGKGNPEIIRKILAGKLKQT